MRLALIAVTAVSLMATAACDRASARANASNSSEPAVPSGGADPARPADRDSAAPARTEAGHEREWREVTLPAGTRLPVVLETSVGSDTSRVEQRVEARLARAIVVRGATVVPEDSRISGVVTDATRSGRVKGRAHVAVRFDTLVPHGSDARYGIHTAAVGRVAPGTKKKDALEIGAPAAGGALIGALLGGKKGALIGTAAGGGAGTAVVLSTRGQEVHLPRGATLTLKLTQPVTIRVRP